ncbi:hypothetical protein RIVM261_048780 [Rivularia sp. IAM M-261]|nr:hypothetical protein RIVM261_048780 [Rivularia sp. IAM M-261]
MTNPAQKPQKPVTLEELEADQKAHPERGLINGILVVERGSVELRGYIPKPLYDEMIYITRAFSLGKAEAAQYGAWEAIDRMCVHESGQDFLKWKTVKYDGAYRLFRGGISIGLYESLTSTLLEKGYAPEDMAIIVISCFVSKCNKAYQKRLNQLAEKFQVSVAEILDAFALDAKKIAREKKIEKLKSGGELTELDKEKMD